MNAPDLKQCYENGMMLHNQGKFAEAIESYDKALAIILRIQTFYQIRGCPFTIRENLQKQ